MRVAASWISSLDPAGQPPGPATFRQAPRIQAALGANQAVALTILTAACSGSTLFALITAHYLRCGTMRRVLGIGADQLSRWLDWE